MMDIDFDVWPGLDVYVKTSCVFMTQSCTLIIIRTLIFFNYSFDVPQLPAFHVKYCHVINITGPSDIM